MKKRAHLLISGNVQGVFYRSFVKSQGKLYGVSGWVRNTADGRVEVVLEGEDYKIEDMIDACRKGPPSAQIGNVDVEWQKFRGTEEGFEIRR